MYMLDESGSLGKRKRKREKKKERRKKGKKKRRDNSIPATISNSRVRPRGQGSRETDKTDSYKVMIHD